jgi:murein DD-endopeptidase MepM/ murein hydrolase activator NlpD
MNLKSGNPAVRRHSWAIWLLVIAVIVPAQLARPSAAAPPAAVPVALPPALPFDPVVSIDAARDATMVAEPPIEVIIELAVASIPPPPPPPPVWVCPISSPVRFEDTYGEGRNGGRRHLGVDLTAPMGTPTVAPVAGTVRYSKDANGGLSWHLDGDDGVYYYGTHLSRFGSVTGRVAQGTVIGFVGMTGNASIPHLHLEIHPGGITAPAINPTPTAAKYCNNTLGR